MSDQPVFDNHMQDRISGIFSDQNLPSYASIPEVEAMQTRIRELDAQLASREASREKTTQSTDRSITDSSATQTINEQQEKEEQVTDFQKNAFRVAVAFTGVALLSIPFYLYLARQTVSWQMNVMVWMTIMLTIVPIASALFARQGRVTLSVSLLLGTICLMGPGISMLISGLGV